MKIQKIHEETVSRVKPERPRIEWTLLSGDAGDVGLGAAFGGRHEWREGRSEHTS